jgi:CheY-like chemotaxis protein
MSVDDATTLLDAVSRLLGALAWPGVILFLLIRYRSSFKAFFETLSEFSFEGAGFKASAKRKQVEATASLVAATVAHQEVGATPETTARDAKAAATAVEAVSPRTIRRAGTATVLWVDDQPRNNFHEQQALEALGVNFVISTSTEDAIAKIQKQKFDVVISDMRRPPDSRAGYTLLEEMRKSGDATPFVIYAGSRAPEHVAESRRRGAMGCTNRPDELFEYVLSALGRGD